MKNKEKFVLIKIISLLIIFVVVLIPVNSLSIKVLALNEDSIAITTTPPSYDNKFEIL